MAALGSQSIASSYEQLLHVDADGGGNSTTHVSVKDGDNGTTFGFTIATDALMMSSTNRLEFGDTGTYIHQSADGVLDLVSDTEIEINATTIDMNGALDLSGNAQLSGTVTVGADGSGTDVIFYSGTAGDNLTWDASDEKLIITGTDGTTALDVADGNVSITDDLAVDGTSNLDNTDIDGTFAVDGTTISLDATTSLNIDNSNTSNGITVGTATSGVPISIGHTTSETTVNDNLVVTGDIDLAGSIDCDGTANLDIVDIDGAVDMASTLTVGGTLTVAKDTGGGVTSAIINNSSAAGSSDEDAALIFQHAGFDGGKIVSDRSGTYDTTGQKQSHLKFYTSNNADDQLVMFLSKQKQVLINDDANASSTQGLTINQGANDDEIISLKSSDVSHPQTNTTEADTFGRMMKASATGGGLRIDGINDANNIAVEIIGNAQGDSDGRSTSTNGAVVIKGVKTTGNDPGDLPSDSNILVVYNRNTARFIFDTDGDFHADSSSTTFDQYNDAQLVRAFDLSHGKGVIKSKFDEFVNYQHETLAELELVGREEDGTPNHFVNVTGMQRLHNGAIWQQYTEMQKMKELMYDTMVEMLGKEKADKKLKDHDVKLLENKNLLN